MRNPFVKKIQTSKGYYLYDVNTNHILKVPEVIYTIIEDLGILSHQDIINKYSIYFDTARIVQGMEKIRRTQQEGLLLHKRPEQVRLSLGERRKELSLSSIALEVTENCNLHCGYCLYCSKDYPTFREHSKKNMSLQNGYKAIDFFARYCSPDSENLIIGFYGGEPVLNLPLIKELVSYSKRKLDYQRLRFTLTSNGTLLIPSVLDYLVEEDFLLTLSLDGPEAVHDRMRVKKDDYTGTFRDVMAVLDYLQKNHPAFFNQNLSFSTVLAPPFDFEELDNFFSRFPIRVLPSMMEYNDNISRKQRITAPGWDKLKTKFREKIRDHQWGRDYRNRGGSFLFSLFVPGLKKFVKRNLEVSPFPNIFKNSFGFCYPGEERLFIDSEGQIYLCEKVDGNGIGILGDLETGIDWHKVDLFLDLLEEHEYNTCQSCWLIRLCSICPARILFNNQISSSKIAFNCQNGRELFAELLQMYCEIMEEDEELLDFLI